MAMILAADDDVTMRTMLGASLRRAGFDVLLAKNGEDLLAELDATNGAGNAPDLVITDIRMPGTSGLEVLARIRKAVPLLPVILITAFGDRKTHERARALGASAVLDKLFDLRELRRHVEALIGHKAGSEAGRILSARCYARFLAW
ncbi:MAG: response regulator [Proteobacteria bacterium]|nr:response regulator [Pseudomonadota bacterium]